MSDIFATPAAGTSRPVGTAAGEMPVRVVDASPEFSRLTTGESLRGTVVGRDDHGHLLVRTRLGLMNLASLRALPVGTEVVLQVRSVGPQVILTLMPLEAAAGSSAQAAQAQPTGTAAQSTPALPPNPADLVQRGQTLRGLLQAAPPMPLLTGLPTAEPGTDLLVRILSLGIQSLGATAAAGTPAAPGIAGNPAPGLASPGLASPGLAGPGLAGLGPAANGQTGPSQTLPGQTLAGQTPLSGATPGSPGAPTGAGSGTTAALGNGATGGLPPAATATGATLAGQGSGAAAAGTTTSPSGTSGPAQPAAPAAAGSLTGQSGPADIAPGLRLGPQAPVASSGHSLATALQAMSTEAAARAAGNLSSQVSPANPGLSGSTPAAIASNTSGPGLRVTGLVTATTSSGQPILHTPLGILTLNTQAALPLGTSLALEVALPAAGPLSLQALASAWPSLETLEQALFSTLPPAQMDAVARALPQIGPRLASGVLFFLTALNQGSVAGWFAPNAAAAKQGERSDLNDRLGRELANLNRSIETAAGEWRFVNLPLWSEQGLRELRCFFRQQEQRDGKEREGEKATRFVLELELKQHGELQLDGLVRRQQFDLVLRSRRPLPAVVRGDLRVLFEETNAIAGYSGQLVFQSSRDWLQMLAAQSSAKPHDGLTV